MASAEIRGSRPTTAADLRRLAAQVHRIGVRLVRERLGCEVFATSASDPGLVYKVTGLSCTCAGFVAWGRCQHHALLVDALGWIETPDPEPGAPSPAAAVPVAPFEATPAVATAPAAGMGACSEGDATTPEAAVVLPFVSREERAKGLAATIDSAIAHLSDQLSQGHSEEYKAFLTFYGKFWRYSSHNVMLIHQQCPHASLVAGMAKWNALGYRVKKGERAVWILAPILKRELDAATGEAVERVIGFKPVRIFDRSQLANLDAKPLPSPVRALPDDAEALYQRVTGRIEAQGIAVRVEPLPPGVEGASRGGRIALRPGLGSRERVLVLLHEYVHELCDHGEGQPARPAAVRELIAESVSFVVGAALGVEHHDARDYLLEHRIGPDDLKRSLVEVQALVRRVLAVVEEPAAVARAAA